MVLTVASVDIIDISNDIVGTFEMLIAPRPLPVTGNASMNIVLPLELKVHSSFLLLLNIIH